MDDKKLLRDAYQVLHAHAEPNINVERVKQRIQARLGDDLNKYGFEDPYYPEILQYVLATGIYKLTPLLREFHIGYGRLAKIQLALEEAGILSPMGVNGQREVLKPAPLKVVNK